MCSRTSSCTARITAGRSPLSCGRGEGRRRTPTTSRLPGRAPSEALRWNGEETGEGEVQQNAGDGAEVGDDGEYDVEQRSETVLPRDRRDRFRISISLQESPVVTGGMSPEELKCERRAKKDQVVEHGGR